jgi:glycosyltransferase involved in cell wall biosynthesis
MTASHLRISLVIPAYNEEDHLRACLDAVAKQTVKPFEVIVVDNNSTDATAAIAKSYPFVRLVREARQGVVYARDAGFDAAKGDIIGRIDVDTLLMPDWVANVQEIFAAANPDAVTGSIRLYDVPFKAFFNRVELFFRRYLARNLARRDELFLFGGNMAVRREFWAALRGQVCHASDMHEDIDLAAHAAHRGWHIRFREDLRAQVSARRVDSGVRSFYHYVLANPSTYYRHSLKGRFYMYPVAWLVLIFYPLLRLLYRGYDSTNGRFSLSRMLRASQRARVSPVSQPYL